MYNVYVTFIVLFPACNFKLHIANSAFIKLKIDFFIDIKKENLAIHLFLSQFHRLFRLLNFFSNKLKFFSSSCKSYQVIRQKIGCDKKYRKMIKTFSYRGLKSILCHFSFKERRAWNSLVKFSSSENFICGVSHDYWDIVTAPLMCLFDSRVNPFPTSLWGHWLLSSVYDDSRNSRTTIYFQVPWFNDTRPIHLSSHLPISRNVHSISLGDICQ